MKRDHEESKAGLVRQGGPWKEHDRSQLGRARVRLGLVKWPKRRPAKDLGQRAPAGAAQLSWMPAWTKRGCQGGGPRGATWCAAISRGDRRRRRRARTARWAASMPQGDVSTCGWQEG